jgi:hypothetical protein
MFHPLARSLRQQLGNPAEQVERLDEVVLCLDAFLVVLPGRGARRVSRARRCSDLPSQQTSAAGVRLPRVGTITRSEPSVLFRGRNNAEWGARA